MGNHVFICYAREDAQFVLTFAQQLKDRGVPVWLDRWDIPAGGNWTNSIDNAIQSCANFLIVLSPEAVQSEEVQGEWHTALDDHKPVVPVLLRHCRIPPRLRVFQYVDFTHSASDDSDDVVALEQVVHVLRGKSLPSFPPDPTLTQPDPPPSKPMLRMATDEEIHRFDPKVRQLFEAAAEAPSPASHHARSASRFSLLLVVLAFLLLVGAVLAVYMYRPQTAPPESEGQLPKTPPVVEDSPAKEKDTTKKKDEAMFGKMVEVPAGDFFMGCNEKVDTECDSDEKPGKTMNLPAFSIDQTEVTVEDYKKCADAGPCTLPGSGDFCNWGVSGREKHPMNCVDSNQAKTFCVWAGKRLPTEAEWEKAARGTNGRKYPWGNEWDGPKANVAGKGTVPVGSFPADTSPYGILDMAGNVWEWTGDWYDKEQKTRSVRGGSWLNQPREPVRLSALGSCLAVATATSVFGAPSSLLLSIKILSSGFGFVHGRLRK